MSLLKNIISFGLRRFGYDLHPITTGQVLPKAIPDPDTYQGPEDYARLHRPWLGVDFRNRISPEISENTMLSPMKLYVLERAMRQCLDVEGDVLEAGVASGGTALLIAGILRENAPTKTFWGLDTFSGYPRVDSLRDGHHVAVNDCRAADFSTVSRLLDARGINVRLIEGTIPETLARVTCKQICFAHIDVNLYEPTRAATAFCLERMPRGGMMLFDDYNWPATYGARCAIDEVLAQFHQQVFSLPESTQAFLIRH